MGPCHFQKSTASFVSRTFRFKLKKSMKCTTCESWLQGFIETFPWNRKIQVDPVTWRPTSSNCSLSQTCSNYSVHQSVTLTTPWLVAKNSKSSKSSKCSKIVKIAKLTKVAKIVNVAKIAKVANVAKIINVANVAKIINVAKIAKCYFSFWLWDHRLRTLPR